MRRFLQQAFQALYRGANAAGLLDSAAAERLFIAAYFWYKRLVEDPYARLVARRPELFLHGHIFDIGANIGYNAVLFSRVVSPGFRVFAFEPEETNFRRLLQVISESGQGERIVARRLAVGSGDRRVALQVNPAHPGDHRIAMEAAHNAQKLFQEVSMTSVDRFVAHESVAGPIRFVKVDVQGYELEVSRGMGQTLEFHREIVVGVELAPAALRESGASEEMLLQFYGERGFQLYGMDRKAGLRPLGRSELEAAVRKRGYIDVMFSRKRLE